MQTTSDSIQGSSSLLNVVNASEQLKVIDSLERAVVHYITYSAETNNSIKLNNIRDMFMYARKTVAFGRVENGTRPTNY